MMQNKTEPVAPGTRGEPLRQRVLDAAERLLREGKAEFSMRDLASEAGVSFATPFNQFGSKAAIMQALSARRIALMQTRYRTASPPEGVTGRVFLAIDIAAAVMLEEPGVNRAVMGWLGTAGPKPGQTLPLSTALWALALDTGEGLAEAQRERALCTLPTQLAFAFRGVLSFWTSGELPDEALVASARDIANGLMLGVTTPPPHTAASRG